jgi:hypothetical protein
MIKERETEMADKVKCELWVAINEDGDYVVSTADSAEALSDLIENWGANAARVVKLTALIRPPAVEDAEVVDVTDEAGERPELAAE